jgi:hypothetical protein
LRGKVFNFILVEFKDVIIVKVYSIRCSQNVIDPVANEINIDLVSAIDTVLQPAGDFIVNYFVAIASGSSTGT